MAIFETVYIILHHSNANMMHTCVFWL